MVVVPKKLFVLAQRSFHSTLMNADEFVKTNKQTVLNKNQFSLLPAQYVYTDVLEFSLNVILWQLKKMLEPVCLNKRM